MVQRSLLIRVADASQAEKLVVFLKGRDCTAHREAESQVIVDDCERDSPALATLVALVEE
jgi:hypothetical protein